VQLIRSGSLKEAARADKSLQASTGAMLDFQAPNDVDVLLASSDSQFRYCTEALVHGEGLDLDAIRTQLSQYGDSVVVAGTESLAKIHVHTDAPVEVFDFLDSKDLEFPRKSTTWNCRSPCTPRPAGWPESARSGNGKTPNLAIVPIPLRPPRSVFSGMRLQSARPHHHRRQNPSDGPALDIRAMHRLMREHPDFSMSTSQPTRRLFPSIAIAAGHSNGNSLHGLTAALSYVQAGCAPQQAVPAAARSGRQTGQDGRTRESWPH